MLARRRVAAAKSPSYIGARLMKLTIPILLLRTRTLLVLVLAATLAGCSARPIAATAIAEPPAPPRQAGPANEAIPRFTHVFTIVLENHDYEQVVGSKRMPFFNSLAQQYGLATNYHGVFHPSLPNYLALTGGSTFGIASDCEDCFVNAPNIADQVEASGRTWKAYMEAMPRTCFQGDGGRLYRQKHNPFIYYDNIRKNPERCRRIVPFEQFAADLDAHALPDYVWITPNMCNDGHDCPGSDTDSWLAAWVPKILAAPEWREGGVLFITFDESKSKQADSGCCDEGNGGQVATLVISPLGKPHYRSPIAYDHYSLLRTIEDSWGLPELGGAACACAPPMADFFAQPTAPSSRRPSVPYRPELQLRLT